MRRRPAPPMTTGARAKRARSPAGKRASRMTNTSMSAVVAAAEDSC